MYIYIYKIVLRTIRPSTEKPMVRIGLRDLTDATLGKIHSSQVFRMMTAATRYFFKLPSLKRTANAPVDRPGPKRKIIFQPSIFRCYVSFRECNHWRYTNFSLNHHYGEANKGRKPLLHPLRASQKVTSFLHLPLLFPMIFCELGHHRINRFSSSSSFKDFKR